MKQMILYRRFAAEAQQASKDIHEGVEESLVTQAGPAEAKAVIRLRGDNQKEELTLAPDDLYMVTSADNYVKVQFREGDALKSAVLRSSLKKIEEQLVGHPAFYRCHRMYIVNLHLVNDVSGNAQGLRLHLFDLADAVPVSRSLTETVRKKLHQLSHSPQNA
jgi:DNA-binding LytR/AlgR family response regulator